jgi:hypothetical protein
MANELFWQFIHLHTPGRTSPPKQPEPEAGKLSRAAAIAVVYIPLTVFLRCYLCESGAVTYSIMCGCRRACMRNEYLPVSGSKADRDMKPDA